MKVVELIEVLKGKSQIGFELPNGARVPSHFHITEMGLVLKNFVDCGGKMRNERYATFQLWTAEDVDHRLTAQKFLGIISIADGLYGLQDLEVQVEYQQDTIGIFDLDYNGDDFVLKAKHTACLAEDACGIPVMKKKLELSDLSSTSCCTPGGGCC